MGVEMSGHTGTGVRGAKVSASSKKLCWRNLRLFAGGLGLAFLCAALLMVPHALRAQAVNGTVVGTVTDASGAVVPDAKVTLTNTGTSTSRQGKTDANGYYTFPNMAPGTYAVKVQKEGFSSAQQEGIALLVNSTVRVNLTLQPGQVNETVTVSTAPPLLQTDTARTGTTLSARQAVELPLGNGRNFQNLVTLVPGATRAEQNHSRFLIRRIV